MEVSKGMIGEQRDESGEPLGGTLVFFSMLLFDALLGIYSAISFTFEDERSAIFFAVTAFLTFLGLIVQMVFGLNRYLRFYYGICGVLIYFYVILRGGQDYSGLFGDLGLIFGFVVVLGWRQAKWFFAAMACALIWIFTQDSYFASSSPFPVLIELKFFIAFLGMIFLALGYGYAFETRVESLLAYSREMSALAYEDEMTGLPNRRSVDDCLSQRWEEYKRNGNLFAVLLCNIDNFKELNSNYGIGFGDGVILRVTNVLGGGLRGQDIIARWGGDEFLAVLPGQNYQTALKVAERMRSRVESIELIMGGRPVTVTISIGVASVENALGTEDLISNAESGLYQAKHTGKNRVMLG